MLLCEFYFSNLLKHNDLNRVWNIFFYNIPIIRKWSWNYFLNVLTNSSNILWLKPMVLYRPFSAWRSFCIVGAPKVIHFFSGYWESHRRNSPRSSFGIASASLCLDIWVSCRISSLMFLPFYRHRRLLRKSSYYPGIFRKR